MVTTIDAPVAAVPALPAELYRWKTWLGVPKGLTAETVAGIFAAIVKRDGRVTAAAVLEAARPEESPLHAAFEWKNAAAGEHYRLLQATGLMTKLVIVRRKPDGEWSEPVRAFVRIRELKANDADEADDDIDPAVLATGAYIPAQTAMASPPMREHLVRQAAIELGWWKRRNADLDEFAAIFAVIDAGSVPVVLPGKQSVKLRRP